MDREYSLLSYVIAILTAIGAINWGLVGVMNFDLVAFIFGPLSLPTKIIYTVVGVAGLLTLTQLMGSKIKA